MSPRSSARLLVALSACYGGVLAVLSVLHSSALGIAAIIGAILLGCLWTVRGIYNGRNTTR